MDLKEHLQQMLTRHAGELAAYPWLSEEDRWAELIFCLLLRYSPQRPEEVRSTVAALQELDLLGPETLARLSDREMESTSVIEFVLRRYGFTDSNVRDASDLLMHLSQAILRDFGGHIQLYLRRQGERIRDELAELLSGARLGVEDKTYALSHWLQNALGMPVSLDHEAVARFCEENGVSTQDLEEAADQLNLSLAVVDDLLEMEYMENEDLGSQERLDPEDAR